MRALLAWLRPIGMRVSYNTSISTSLSPGGLFNVKQPVDTLGWRRRPVKLALDLFQTYLLLSRIKVGSLDVSAADPGSGLPSVGRSTRWRAALSPLPAFCGFSFLFLLHLSLRYLGCLDRTPGHPLSRLASPFCGRCSRLTRV